MRASSAIAALALAACGPSGEGTVWYRDTESRALQRLDLASGDVATVDNRGPFSALTADPETRRVAYALQDTVFVAGLGEAPFAVQPSSGYSETYPSWHPGSWLTYNVRTGDSYDVALARPPMPARMLAATAIAFTQSGDRVAYLASEDRTVPVPRGDLIIESPDGSNHVVLAADVELGPIAFTPDATSVLTTDSQNNLLRYPSTGGSAYPLGEGFVLRHFVDTVSASPDGSRVIVHDSQGLAVVSWSNGERERLVAGPAGAGAYGAMFLDDEAILYSHTTFQSDTASSTSVHVVRDAQDTLVLEREGWLCAAMATYRNERVAILCGGNAYVLDVRTATIERTEPASSVLGFSADGEDLYVESYEGDVVRLPVDGEASVVAHAVVGPVAYLP